MYTHPNQQWSLISAHGNEAKTPPDTVFTLSKCKQYDIYQGDICTFHIFYYSEDCQIAVCLDGQLNDDAMNYLYYLLYPCYAHYTIQLKEKELDKFIEGVQDITASLDLDELLTKILENVLSVTMAGDAGILWLYDSTIDSLVCKAFVGWKDDLKHMRLKIGEGIAGKTFQDGKPRIYHSMTEAVAGMNSMSDENRCYLRASFSPSMETKDCKVTVSVPISVGNQTKGVMMIHQFEREKQITKRDLQLLMGFSAQVAIAIENAYLFTEVKRQNRLLIKRNEVHETLTKLSLQNMGVERISRELEQMLGMPFVFLDFQENEHYPKKHGHPLEFSMEELSKLFSKRTVPANLDKFEAGRIQSYFLYPILVGTICLGGLIVSLERPLTQQDHITLEQGRSVLALELVKKQSLTEVYYKNTHEFFNELLENKEPNLLYAKGLDLGINLNAYMVAAIFKISSYHDLQALATSVHRLVLHIKRMIPQVSKIEFGFNDKATLLLSLSDPAKLQNVLKRFKSILEEWEFNDGPPLCAGIGTPYKGIDSVNKTYSEANKALSYLVSRHRTGMIQYSEIGVNRLFLNQSTEEIKSFRQEVFGPLNTAKAQNSDLENTLLSYIENDRSVLQTAKKLHIHTNTLYHRLKKIEELLHLSLHEPEDILKIQLACYLRSE
jgi:sugar diacid utilization regulator